MEVKNLCYKKYISDRELEKEFISEDGYIILLTLISEINEYANQVNAIAYVINVLEDWKNKEFYTNETTYEINWSDCYNFDKSVKKLTLKQAKKLYKETKIKYEVLYNLFVEAAYVHYENNTEELINKYFSFKGDDE